MPSSLRSAAVVVLILGVFAPTRAGGAEAPATRPATTRSATQPANEYEELMADMIGFADDVTAVVTAVKDKASADASGPKFDALRERALKLRERTEALDKPSDPVREAMMKKFGPRLTESTDAMVREQQRIEDDEQLAELMKPNLDKLKVFGVRVRTESN